MIQKLSWDSKFFRKKIARISVLNDITYEKLYSSIKNLFKKRFECVYLEIPKNKKSLIQICNEQKFFLADNKLILKKEVLINTNKPAEIKDKISEKFLPRIFEITDEISLLSRFYKDPKFRPFAKKLYHHWIENSLFHNYADKYFFSFESGKPAGLIILKRNKYKMFINLFGVHKNYRRKGIGTKLLSSAESWAREHRYSTLYVPTQKNNEIAISVYEKFGFKYFQEIFFYHVWRENFDKNTV